MWDLLRYRREAWNDFLANQITPFTRNGIRVFLGIGNHELLLGSRRDFRAVFKAFLPPEARHDQDGRVDYHFAANGVDFIYLDNADSLSPDFTERQLVWLTAVLRKDSTDPMITTVVGAMHATLPGSKVAYHAMDASCPGRASGWRAYELFEDLQATQRNVYLFASHSHSYTGGEVGDIYAEEHPGRPVPGWVMGMAGSAQYSLPIRYGYLLCEVDLEGKIQVEPRWIAKGESHGLGSKLLDGCYNHNLEARPVSQRLACDACGRGSPDRR